MFFKSKQGVQETFSQGVQAIKEGKYPRAVQYFEESIKLYQTSASNAGSEHLLACYVNIGEIKKNTGDFEGAIPAYEKALSLNPNQEDIYLKLAQCYLEVSTYDTLLKAMNTLADCVARFPNSQAAHMNLGIAYLRADAKDEARAVFLKAKRLGNKDAEGFIRDFCS